MPEPSRTTRRFERELADVARSTAMRVMIDGEPGSGRLFAARRIHQLRTPGTTLAIHLAGLAQLRGTPAWLAELARLLADQNVTVAVTNLELLDESAVCCWPRPGPAAAPRSGPSTWAPRSPRARGRQTLTRLESVERDAIVDAMRESGGNEIQAAAALGMSRSTLYRRLRMYVLQPGRTRPVTRDRPAG
jgi:DNA-binding NtrC family response regulator